MTKTTLVSVLCEDRTGLLAGVSGTLFDLGINLGDTSFAVLGEGAEFTALCDTPDELEPQTVENALAALPELAGAEISVTPFGLSAVHGPAGVTTHRVQVSGGDRPGLVARLCEVFQTFKANIVRLSSERVPAGAGFHYAITIHAAIPPDVTDRCLNTIANTAGELHLDHEVETVEPAAAGT